MTPWRDTWKESDPKRACWGCGASPTSRYTNGSPRYSCGPHPVGVLTPEELAHLGARRWKAGDTVDMGPLHFRVRPGSKVPGDLVLELDTPGGWVRLPMAVMFLQADFYAENEQHLKDSGERPGWKFGGVEYLQPRLDRAMQSGWGPVAAEVTEQRRAKERP